MKRPIPFCILILILAAALCFSACAENKTPGDVFMPIDESDAYPSETVRADFSTEAPKDYTLPVDETTAAPDSDAALDVLNHYSNMFIASKVNNYLNIRNAPSTEGAIIGKLTKDAGGEILEDAGDGWYRIQSGGIEGFVSGSYIITGDEARAFAPSVAVEMVHIIAERLNVRTGPGLDYEVWTQLGTADRLTVDEDLGEWYKIRINNTDGYISKDFAEPGWYLMEAMPWTAVSGTSEKRQKLFRYAEQFIGIPYKMGGESLEGYGIDCSSFVQQCLKNALGIGLDRTSRQLATRGYEVSLADAKPGDLMFYTDPYGEIDHVAFYMGDGKILHASRSFGQVAVSAYNYASEPVLIKNVIGD